jgi:hypothetical protein
VASYKRAPKGLIVAPFAVFAFAMISSFIRIVPGIVKIFRIGHLGFFINDRVVGLSLFSLSRPYLFFFFFFFFFARHKTGVACGLPPDARSSPPLQYFVFHYFRLAQRRSNRGEPPGRNARRSSSQLFRTPNVGVCTVQARFSALSLFHNRADEMKVLLRSCDRVPNDIHKQALHNFARLVPVASAISLDEPIDNFRT